MTQTAHAGPEPAAPGDTAACRLIEATKAYGSGDTFVRALDALDVGFPRAQFTAVMGPSGSGKSTLLHCAAGLDRLDSGKAVLGGVDLGTLSDRELTLLRRDRIGFVFQAFNLVPTLDAAENIALPRTLAGAEPDADWFAELVGTLGLGDRLRHRPAELSGGQQQRVSVARALLTRPEVVFADEPTGNLDSRAGHEVLSFLRVAVNRFGQTVVMVTHDPVAASFADSVVFLADGAVAGRLTGPTAATVLDRLKTLEG